MSITSPAGKCAVVTGGAGLLGRSMALAFGRAGMKVVVADIRGEAAATVAAEVAELGVETLAVTTDVSRRQAVFELADAVFARFDQVNLLCNNAGGVSINLPWDLTAEDWDSVTQSHLGGVINGLLAFLPRLIEQRGDRHIVNTSSMAGVGLGELRPTTLPYVAAKFAITGLTEALAPALAPKGIGVSVLNPGLVNDADNPTFLTPSGEFYRSEVVKSAGVGDCVLRGVQNDQLHIFTHRTGLLEIAQRHELLLKSYRESIPGFDMLAVQSGIGSPTDG
jgi:NAD(P)-dependent dehydrogenase (short-subunit alcohol dehydrogenase family)